MAWTFLRVFCQDESAMERGLVAVKYVCLTEKPGLVTQGDTRQELWLGLQLGLELAGDGAGWGWS